MSIRHLSYASCDRCGGNPAQPGDSAREARGIARTEGYTRVAGEDICGRCSGNVDEFGRPTPQGVSTSIAQSERK